MNSAIRLALLGVLLALSSCAKEAPEASALKVDAAPVPITEAVVQDAPQGDGCKDCQWETFLNKELPVPTIECTNANGEPEHCHLLTEGNKPKREARVMHDEATGGYSFAITSHEQGEEANRMECVNLIQDPDNRRVVMGTCVILNADKAGSVHHFKATIKPRVDEASKPEIVFQFRHKPFDGSPDPVHNGEGHATTP